MKTPEKPLLELEISDLSRGGAGVAKVTGSGRVVFVPWTAPGDRVRVRITREEKRFAHAELVEILTPSPIRRKAPCVVFGRCGGCQWQHIPYEFQWKTKISGLKHALGRAGVQTALQPFEFPAEEEWQYRNRVQLRGDGARLGFYAPGSHEIVAIERCEISRPEINAALAETRTEGSSKQPYKVELEVLANGELRKHWNLPHAAGGFRQINDRQNERLKTWVDEQLPAGAVLYDLFGGSGNLSLAPARRMRRTYCIDRVTRKPADAPPHMEFHSTDVLPWLRKHARLMAAQATGQIGSMPAAIVDPPREGLGGTLKEIAATLALLGVKRVVCVGCDVDAWSSDLKKWLDLGWKLEKLGALDFFPQTPHIEALALLTR